jgi:hypothetical protein
MYVDSNLPVALELNLHLHLKLTANVLLQHLDSNFSQDPQGSTLGIKLLYSLTVTVTPKYLRFLFQK